MIKIVTKIMERRKVSNIILACIILLFSIISFISISISQQTYSQKLKLALKEYGGFSQAIIPIKDDEYNKLIKNNFELGSFYCQDVFCIKNKKYTVGYVDNNFEKMANIKLIKGKKPEDGQIIIEEILEQVLNKSINDSLEINGKFYKISGVCNNYASVLPLNEKHFAGESDYPQIIKGGKFKGTKSTVVGFNSLEEVSNNLKGSGHRIEKYIEDSTRICNNADLYDKGLEKCVNIKKSTVFFIIVVQLSLFIFLYSVFQNKFYYSGSTVAIIQNLGVTKGKSGLIIAGQIFLICAPAIIFEAVKGLVIIIKGKSLLYLFSTVTFLGIYGIIILIFYYKAYKNVEITKSIRADRFSMERKQIVRLKENTRLGSLFTRINVVSVLVMSCILISGFIPINEAKYIKKQIKEEILYQIISTKAEGSRCHLGYRILTNDNSGFSIDDVEKLSKYGSYVNIERCVNSWQQPMLLIKKDKVTKKIKQWVKAQREEFEINETDKKIKNFPKEAESFMPIPTVDVIQLTDNERKDFMKKYNVKKDETVVFNDSGMDLSSILKDEATLGKVTISKGRYTFNKHSLHISRVINKKYSNPNVLGEGLITIVVPKSNVKIESLISGYNDIFIEAKNNIDVFNLKDSKAGEELKKLDSEVNRISGKIQSGEIKSKINSYNEQKSYIKLLNINSIVSMIFVFMSAIIFFFNEAKNILRISGRNMAIVSVLGMEKQRIIRMIFIRWIKEIGLSLVLDFSILSVYISVVQIPPTMLTILCNLVIVVVISMISRLIIAGNINKTKEVDWLRGNI